MKNCLAVISLPSQQNWLFPSNRSHFRTLSAIFASGNTPARKMAADNEAKPSANSDDANSSGMHWTPTSTGPIILLSSVFAATVFSAFAMTIRTSRREGEPSLPLNAERPSRLALRALGLGTLGAVLGTGTLCVSLAYALGIKEVRTLPVSSDEWVKTAIRMYTHR